MGTIVNRPELLSDLLDEERVAPRRDAEALTDGTRRLTWGDYAERVAKTAGALVALGASPGDRIGVHLPKSVDSFVAVHAVLRAGCVLVPLDAFAPTDHTASVVRDAGVEVAVTAARGQGFGDLVAGGGLRAALQLADDEPRPEPLEVCTRADVDAVPPLPRVGVDPGDPAYIMYTSGSTGRPKGIVHTHRSGLAYAWHSAALYGLDEADRMANIAPLHFDQSTFELYAAPVAGAAVVVVPDGVLRFPASLSTLVQDERVTVWYSVPHLIEQLSTRGALAERDLGTLRWVLFGGESFPTAALARAMRQLPSARFSNVYGPAEVNQCTYHHLDDPPLDDGPIPIGRPWDAAEVLIVDDRDHEVEGDAAGELLVRTDTMMDRYWNRPDLTAAAMVSLPGDAGGRWYRTGDLVRHREDGNLVFLGRRDNQVKVRGHRVELEAVESIIADQPGVEECVVLVQRPDDGDDHLVALVTPASLTDDDGDTDLLRELTRRLPRYAVPSEVRGVAGLPRTATGKVDRGAAAAALASAR